MAYRSPMQQAQQGQQRYALPGAMNGYQPQQYGGYYAQPGAITTGQAPTAGAPNAGAQPTGYNPLQPTYAPAPPQGQAATSNINLSPQATIAQILKGFAPQSAMATNNLNNTLAASGIVGGGAQSAQQLLQGQLAASLAPTLANAIQGSQGMELQQGLGNAGMTNQMTSQNLQDWLNTNFFNAGAANTAGSQLAQMLQGAWGTQAGSLSNLLSQGLGGASGLAGQEASNFPIYPNNTVWGWLGI